MKGIQLTVEGNWAHFKKPETNNNPLTYDFITKTAFIGLVGAVLGVERSDMRSLFPQLSEDLFYGVKVINPVRKKSWGFTMRRAVNQMEKAPKYLEFLKSPKFQIVSALLNARSEELFIKFSNALKTSKAMYTPVLGLHNCPANLEFQSEGEFSNKQNGKFKTTCFISKKHILDMKEVGQFRIGFERMPTFQNDEFWNLPDKYVEVIYPSPSENKTCEIIARGDYYEYSDGECWWLI